MDPVLDDPLDRLPLPFLIGPTGVGKSALALELSAQTGCELISLDSMQVYRGMDIGTAKATAAEREAAPHHMPVLVEASARSDVALYLDGGRGLWKELGREGQWALAVGGPAAPGTCRSRSTVAPAASCKCSIGSRGCCVRAGS